MYFERFGKEPPVDIFDEFFWLFYKRYEELPLRFARQMKWHDRFDETLINFKKTKPEYDGYEEFIVDARKHCYGKEKVNIE